MLLSLNEKEVTGCLFSVSIFLFFLSSAASFFFFLPLLFTVVSLFSFSESIAAVFFFFQFD